MSYLRCMTDLELAREAARRAADVVERYFETDIGADMKGAVDPVTQADRDAEAAILELLAQERPDDSILGEESGVGGSNPAAVRRWYIDPLDGTVNFANRIPHCSVSIALYEGAQPLVGVVHDIFRGEVFWAEAGKPAFLDGAPMGVRTNQLLSDAVIVTGFPYDRQDKADQYSRVVAAVLSKVRGIRRFGSAALDFAWVAAGRFDAYWEYGLGPWDAAAGAFLVERAGGEVTAIDGPLDVNRVDSVVAAHPALRQELVEILRTAVPRSSQS